MPSLDNIIAQGLQPTTAWKSPTAIEQEQQALVNSKVINQANQLKIQQEQEAIKRQQQSQQAWARAAQEAGPDPDKFLTLGVQYGGTPEEQMRFRAGFYQSAKAHSELDKEKQALSEAQNKRLMGALESVPLAGNDPIAQAYQYKLALNQLKKEGIDISHLPESHPGMPTLTGIINAHGMAGSAIERAKAEQAVEIARLAEERNQADQVMQAAKEARDAEDYATKHPIDAAIAADTLADPNHLTPEKRIQVNQNAETAKLNQKKFEQDLADFAEKVRHNKVDEAETLRYHNLSMGGVTLTPEAKDKMAEMFATTGVLPALGQGKAAAQTRSEIINAAAQKFPQVDFASNKAAYQANTTSLRNLQKTVDQVDAFEKTASKNIDIFLNSAKKIIDTGSPLLNSPVRSLSSSVFGSENMSAFQAARETALTEAAKVLESPGGNAAITVSGREAVKHLSDPNATLGQQISAMKILKQDMANRKQSNSEQIKAIQDRISAGNSPSPAASGNENDPLNVVEWEKGPDGRPRPKK